MTFSKLIIIAFFIAFGTTLLLIKYKPVPLVPTPPQIIYIHDTTVVRDIIFKCGRVKHDTIVIHVKD